MNEVIIATIGGAAGTLLATVIAYLFKENSVRIFLKDNAWNVGLTIAAGSIGALLLFQENQQLVEVDLPIGTVLASSLDATEFFRQDDGLVKAGDWVPADGRPISANSEYARRAGVEFAPDLTSLENAKVLLKIVRGQAASGTSISTLQDGALLGADWDFHFGLHDIEGNENNGDYEHTRDNFQIVHGENLVTAQGRTYNKKRGNEGWGDWRPGSVNYLGIATDEAELYYYVRID